MAADMLLNSRLNPRLTCCCHAADRVSHGQLLSDFKPASSIVETIALLMPDVLDDAIESVKGK